MFAGLGGLTQGLVQAGADVVWAGNHNPLSVEYHALNHPTVVHTCQDHHLQDFYTLPDVDAMACAPCCQGHGWARGKDRPRHAKSRATAWAVVQATAAKRPEFVLVENVPGFRNWDLLPAWEHAFRLMGYSVSYNEWDSADSGVPQNRVRLFILFTRSRSPLHIYPSMRPHRSVRDYLAWDETFAWTPVSEKVEATRRRVERGRRELGDRFVMPYYSNGSGLTGRSVDRPIGTLTGADRWGVVDGDRMRMVQPAEAKLIMSFPPEYRVPKTKKKAIYLLGQAVCPAQAEDVARAIMRAG